MERKTLGVLEMTDLRTAAQQALKALEKAVVAFGPGLTLQQNAITALRQALAEQDDDLTAAWMAGAAEERKRAEQAQPVAWMVKDEGLYWTEEAAIRRADRFVEPLEVLPLYTTPPAPQPLTDYEVLAIYQRWDETPGTSWADFARAVEREVLRRMGVQP
jgi:hypothetical protein